MPWWVRWKTQILNKISKTIQVLARFHRVNTRNTYGNVSDPLDRVSFSSRSKNGSQKNGFLLFSGLFANLWSSVQFHISGLLFLWHCFSHNCGLHFLPRWWFELLVPSHRYWSFNFLPSHSCTVLRSHDEITTINKYFIKFDCAVLWLVERFVQLKEYKTDPWFLQLSQKLLFVDLRVLCKMWT